MKVSTKGRYALRLMLDLAQFSSGEHISLKEISARQAISVKYLEQIVPLLVKDGLIQSTRGSSGGYRLARRTGEYTVGEILRAAEGSMSPIACLDNNLGGCDRAAYCQTLPFWQGLDKTIADYIDGVTLEDLILQSQNIGTDNYVI
ncbi:MAG: Rrf2 family transcriptional regulator [Oscillospiraceae bacterium]|jgi:Rrf2 family protein|nr:Rrf2 family transcriptional regulator [Oscillospiraceae bacterium]